MITQIVHLKSEAYKIPSDGAPTEETGEAQNRASKLHQLVSRLPFDEREIIEDKFLRDIPISKTAARLGITVSQANHRCQSALRRMQADAMRNESQWLYAEAS